MAMKGKARGLGEKGKGDWEEAQKRILDLEQKVRRNSTLVSMLVHDLKGPLSSLISNLDLLAGERLSPGQRESLEIALAASQDLYQMIQNLLELGKMEQGEGELNLSIFSVASLLEEVERKVRSLARQRGINTQVDCRDTAGPFAADRLLLERIIYNLLLNAFKHSPEGGRVVLFTKDAEKPGRIILGVSDEGRGIPPEFREAIFDLYQQVDCRQEMRQKGIRELGSVGLGLAFCRQAAERHGGRIWVESTPGRGSAFFVELPTDLTPYGSGIF